MSDKYKQVECDICGNHVTKNKCYETDFGYICKDCINNQDDNKENKMTAKEMFEALGYTLYTGNNNGVVYKGSDITMYDSITITQEDFGLNFQTGCERDMTVWIDIKLCKAIIQQIKELENE